MNYTAALIQSCEGDTAYHITQYPLHGAPCELDIRKNLLCSEELVFFPIHLSYKHYYMSLSGFIKKGPRDFNKIKMKQDYL